ncbi:MAG: ABC transporter permease [Mycoplasma sp.]|nr:ABC transporter permease [Mycoplasma sp.]
MWNIIKEEINNIRNKRWGIFSLIIILFVPAVYSGIFLSAFKNPMHKMNAANVVVMELGNNQNYKKYFNGKHELKTATDKLYMDIKEAPSVYKTQKDIEKAVDSNKYQAAIIIPENFGTKIKKTIQDIAKNPNSNFVIPKIIFYVSYKNNYLQAELLEMRSQIYSLHKDIFFKIIKDIIPNNLNKTKMVLDIIGGVSLVNKITNFKGMGSDTINDYGQGMLPYFFSIGIWAGCVMMVFLYKNHRHGKYSTQAKTIKNYFSRSILWICTGWIQTLLLLLISLAIGLNINISWFYLIIYSLFVSTIFSLIVQSIAFAFRMGEIGSFIVLILLIMQLVSASGTFPVELQVGFFQIIHPIIPFTYTIDTYREFLYQPDTNTILNLIWPLLLYLLLIPTSLTINYIFDKIKLKKHGKYKSYEINLNDE